MAGYSKELLRRAAIHSALGEPARLAIIDELSVSDRSPRDLGSRLQLPSNLLAHHLDTLENIGLILRSTSSGDARRRYVRLDPASMHVIGPRRISSRKPLFFLCTHNSARSQLAAAIWQARTGQPAKSAGTQPAAHIHRQAISAAKRNRIELRDIAPSALGKIPRHFQVVTVCDLVHEELHAPLDWWHWSIPDPVPSGNPKAFDAVVAELEVRVNQVLNATVLENGDKS
jgi:protein-tyrosine-phosphatase/DNA-binding transcriptional ArsR family regulator